MIVISVTSRKKESCGPTRRSWKGLGFLPNEWRVEGIRGSGGKTEREKELEEWVDDNLWKNCYCSQCCASKVLMEERG